MQAARCMGGFSFTAGYAEPLAVCVPALLVDVISALHKDRSTRVSCDNALSTGTLSLAIQHKLRVA